MYHEKISIVLFTAGIACFSAPIFASTESCYIVRATDLSLSYLNAIFGNVGDVLVSGTGSMLVAEMFSYFNAGIFTFTMAILTYVFSSVIATAQEGKAITEKFNSWIMIRSGLSVGLLTVTRWLLYDSNNRYVGRHPRYRVSEWYLVTSSL